MINKLLAILREISEILTHTNDYNVVLGDIVKILSKDLEVEVCSVYVYDKQSKELVLKASDGLNEESVNVVKITPGEGLTGRSFKKREILNISMPKKHPHYIYFKSTGEEKYNSYLAMPLTVSSKCVGVLVIQSKSTNRFPHEVVDMVKSLSTQLANLILNTNILDELSVGDNQPIADGLQEGQVMLRGIAVNPGTVRGRACVFATKKFFEGSVRGATVPPDEELAFLEASIKLTKEKTAKLEENALSMISEIDASIFYVHLLFLDDITLINRIRDEITGNHFSLEYSVTLVFKEYQKKFHKLEDQVFRDKIMDLKDVLLRLLESARQIKEGRTEQAGLTPTDDKMVLIAEELLPSDLMRMPLDNIVGVVCERGGVTAHVAILSKALGIPALLGVKKLLEQVKDSDDIIIDCHSELLYINPSNEVSQQFEEIMSDSEDLDFVVDKRPVTTADGHRIKLRGNIALISETSLLAQYGAEGVGLYRTEFLYMVRDYLPSEEDQYRVFSRIIKEAQGEEATIRVLDAGADKPIPYINTTSEDNPALGNRGIRLLLKRQDILRPHLRAILRAGVFGKLKLLFPMVTNIDEMLRIRQIITEIENELKAENIDYATDYKVGIMLEVPSTVFGLNKFIDEVDYMSIGSNDLLQYTFAADRGNEEVADIYNALDPIFLHILETIGANFRGIEDKHVTICGEMAGSIYCAPFLIGAGIYDLSMAPRMIPKIKNVISKFTLKECENLLNEALLLNSAEAVIDLIKKDLTDKGIAFKPL